MKKIVLIGRAGVGKTTIKRVIFDGTDPLSLILHPLAPTRGIHTFIYKWIDLNLNLFDTSGQELPFLLEDKTELLFIFEKSDALIYVVDYSSWVSNYQEIIDEIIAIYNLLINIEIKSRLILFLHKIDLISQKIKEKNRILINNLNVLGELPEEFPVFFTSLHPEFIFTTYNAFNEILSNLSSETSNLKKILDKRLDNYSTTMCLIVSQNDSVIVQSTTTDFDMRVVFNIHKKLYEVLKYSPDLFKKYKQIVPIDVGPRIFSVTFETLGNLNINLKDLICISEVGQKEKLERLNSEIIAEFENYYNSNK